MEFNNTFQAGLFDAPAPAQIHSRTSVEAGLQIEKKSISLRGHVLAFLRGRGAMGATDEEMQIALNMNPSTQRPRRIELVAAGLARDSAMTRETKSGRKAVVWVAT